MAGNCTKSATAASLTTSAIVYLTTGQKYYIGSAIEYEDNKTNTSHYERLALNILKENLPEILPTQDKLLAKN